MPRTLSIVPNNSEARVYPTVVATFTLTTNAVAVPVPAGDITHCFFEATHSFAVAYGTTVGAVTASLSSAASTGNELNPVGRYIGGKGAIQELSIIGASTGQTGFCSVAFYNSGSTST